MRKSGEMADVVKTQQRREEQCFPGGPWGRGISDARSACKILPVVGSHADCLFWHCVLGGDSAKATSQDFMSKGPQIVEDLPAKTGKEELKARMEELNK